MTFSQAGFVEGMPSETVSKVHLVDLAGRLVKHELYSKPFDGVFNC